MDYREQAFIDKFTSAGEYLDAPPDRIISLKLRDMVSSSAEYRKMLPLLASQAGIRSSEVHGNLQGRGYLIDHEGQKVLVVEHETGLEILYIAGSIASLIGVIPIVLQCWGTVRGYLDQRHARQFRSVEIRKLDGKGKLQEDRFSGLAGPSALPLSVLNTALSSAARIFDADIKGLREEVQALSERLALVEKHLKPPKKRTTGKAVGKRRFN